MKGERIGKYSLGDFIGVMALWSCACFVIGISIGIQVTDEFEEKLVKQLEKHLVGVFDDSLIEVRQGSFAGAMVAASGNETLIKAWEEICFDIIEIARKDYFIEGNIFRKEIRY